MRRLALALVLVPLVTGCGGGEGGSDGGTLTIYSGREEEIVEPLFEQYEKASGTKLEVRYGDSAELAATLAEEGDNSPADVFFAQDAGSLGAVADEGRLAKLTEEQLDRVDERYRDPEGQWVGTSGRARVVAYNTDELQEDELPDSIAGFTDPRWKGKLGVPPTNASFQAFVTAMRLSAGEDEARTWLEKIKANEPKFYEKNAQIVEALAAGEIEIGFVNHYYLGLLKKEQPDAPVANHFLRAGDPGALVNAAGVGIVEGTDDEGAARDFVDFLLSDEGQRFYPEEAEEAEYPLVAGIEGPEGLPALDELKGPDIALGDLGPALKRTLELLNELGYTS
ncbi:MAG: iron ABC transporter substrate-binding protein [Actinobacteria bacterium]|nr:iron ABC transporter substrate-binding protein [Actinomycetota bacterium]